MNKFNWEGVFPAMLTPFTADDKLDFALFEKNVNAQLDAGIEGLILGGSLGEASTLDKEEKVQLLVYAVEIVKEKIPVVLTIAEQATKVAIQLAQEGERTALMD